jgi:hypothetical protein
MRQITVRLKFVTPCLGHIRKPDKDQFERDAAGNVIFMNSWWRKVLEFGAQAYGKHQALISAVRFDSVILGTVQTFKRFYGAQAFKEHEAFLPGTEITIRVVIPDGMVEAEFIEILKVAGRYKGISPYGWQDGYGRFDVNNNAASDDTTSGQSA